MKSLFPLLAFFCFGYTLSAQNIYRTACQGKMPRLDSLLVNTKVNTPDNRGRTLLHWAVGCNQEAIFEHLVAKGANINAVDNDGATPLYMAVRFQYMPFFNRLVELQPNDEWKTNFGGSLYEKAILNHDLVFVQKLVELGVPIDIKNNRGSTPLELALRIKNSEISDWLKTNGADETLVRKITAQGEYFGQEPPKNEAKVFVPNFISTEEYEFGSVFNVTGNEFYYGVDLGRRNEIRFTELQNGEWTTPIALISDEKYGYNYPFLSPNEDRLYFISNRATDGVGEPKDIDIWYVERNGSGWSQPINAGPNINSDGEEYYISFSNEGTMYFSTDKNQSHHDIYYSRFVGGDFQEAVKLGNAINTEHYEADVFVAPNEEYLIFCATRPDGLGRGDLYISFKNEDGLWSQSVNMGNSVNTEHHELCPFVTHDGKYLFFTSKQDIYWISTSVINDLKNSVH